MRVNRFGFVAIAVAFHLIYIYSIIDIYFVSPIVHGMRAFSVAEERRGWRGSGDERTASGAEDAVAAPAEAEAPAKRLVLFVGDGLRADKAFQSFPDPSPEDPSDESRLIPRPLAPFLRSVVLSNGTFGVSHTRVPTESRPGHVALIAGLYEDVSAVMTGWKLNPVNFDSVFNRSRHTWSWGSPDILPMFKEGAVQGRIDAEVYSEEAEDFTQDATQLDNWVFDKVKDFFRSAATNATLDALLREDKLVFFLHLLGLDTAGHAYRPYSKEYLHNIKVVDKGVREISQLIDDFYDDQRTAYVFTADHGMSDWGSHGDGHPDNTRTPLIAWGAGVAKPVVSKAADGHEDGFSADWGLDHIARHDVAQADIASLMAYLVGLEFPVNSVGVLPLDYLEADPERKAEAVLVNAREILEMYRVKEERKKATQLKFRPYPPLSHGASSVDERLNGIRGLIDASRPQEAIDQGLELINQGLAGLHYLQRYDWFFLRTLATFGYLGWIAFALTTVIDLHVLGGTTQTARTTPVVVFFSSVLVALYSLLWVQRSPWTYYAYAFFPVFFWEEVVAQRGALAASKKAIFGHINSTAGYIALGVKALVFMALIQTFALGYFHREVFSACYALAALWPLLYGADFIRQNAVLLATWALGCVAMSVFTLLPVVMVEDINLISLGGFIMFMIGVAYLVYEGASSRSSQPATALEARKSENAWSRAILGVQTGLVALAIVVTRSSVASLQAKQGLPFGTQVVGWFVLVSSLIVPVLHSFQPNYHYFHRLMVLFLAFSPMFVILTISYEGLFFIAFAVTLVAWVRLEYAVYQYSNGITPAPSRSNPSYMSLPPAPLPPTLSSGISLSTAEPAPATAVAPSPVTEAADKSNNNSSNKKHQHKPPLSHPSSSSSLPHPAHRPLTLADARTALFFLFFVQSAFFSTGNVASLSSFSLDSVYRLLPVFNPFSQGALLVAKILAPFALVSANLGVLDRRLGVAPSALFMLVAALSDGLTLAFFFRVRDAGSWLDIGTSISHFVIASLLGVFVAALQAVSELLARGLVDIGDDAGGGDIRGVHQPNSDEGRGQPPPEEKSLPSSSSAPSQPAPPLQQQQQQQQPLQRSKNHATNGSAES